MTKNNPDYKFIIAANIPPIIISLIMLVACFAALWTISKGIKVKFSLTIIIMIIIVNVCMISSNLTGPSSIACLVFHCIFDGLVQLTVPINILFTERQWTALKRYNLTMAIDPTERLNLKL